MRTAAPVPRGLPKVLLVTSCRWQFAARLGMALAAAGCAVEAVCPPGHPITRTRAVDQHYPYRALQPLRSIGEAIKLARPDLLFALRRPRHIAAP